MKKIAVFLFLLVSISTLCFSKNLTDFIEPIENKGVYATGNNLESVFSSAFNHGFAYEIFNTVPNVVLSFGATSVIGEFFETTNDNFNLKAFESAFGLLTIKTTQIKNSYNIYAVSSLIPYRVSGLNSNVQISITGNSVKVGAPIIFGSF